MASSQELQPPIKDEQSEQQRREQLLKHETEILLEALVKRLRYTGVPEDTIRERLNDPVQVEIVKEMAERSADSLMKSKYDKLTGLPDFETFNSMYDVASRRTKPGTVSALIAFDIDYFKSVNDRAGHAEGDKLLRSVATEVVQTIRSFDFACRKSNAADEFFVYIGNSNTDEIEKIMARIAGKISGVKIAADVTSPTISAGCVILRPNDHMPFMQAAAMADKALYASKIERGRLTIRDGDGYGKYQLMPFTAEDGSISFQYALEISGNIKELRTTQETCDYEVLGLNQRLIEEVRTVFSEEEIKEKLSGKKFDTIEELEKVFSRLLFEARTKLQEKENAK